MGMADDVGIEVHHGGYLRGGPPYKYEGGTVDIIIHVDLDKFSYWELLDIVVELGYPSTSELYCKLPNRRLEDGLISIMDDRQIMEMIEDYRGIEMWLIYVKSGIGPINLSDKIENANVDKDDHNQIDEDESGNNQDDGNGNNEFQRQKCANLEWNDLEGEENDSLEEGTMFGSDSNNDLVMKIVEPWMLEGLEGLEDDDIFVAKEKRKTNSDVMSPNTKVNDDEECGSDQRLVAIQEIDVVNNDLDFSTNEERGGL